VGVGLYCQARLEAQPEVGQGGARQRNALLA
jgi:hypothetical protein